MKRAAVLVIDDDRDFRDLIRLFVEPEGFDVLEASDCVHGVDILRTARDRVVLVLLDYWMPHMEPVRCAGRILSLVRRETRVVLVTAAVDPGRRAAELGLSRWLPKPFDFERLLNMVGEARRPI